jgi:hypothetical protein
METRNSSLVTSHQSWLAFVISHFSIIDRVVVLVVVVVVVAVVVVACHGRIGDQMELMQQKSEKRLPEVQVIGWIE